MRTFTITALALLLCACNNASSPVSIGASPDPIALEEDEKPGSLPTHIIDPTDNPTTAEKVSLGRLLFWDPVLSGNQDIACASCHHPNHGYADNIQLSLGVGGIGLAENRHGGQLIKRNAPTILNTAYNGIDENGQYNPSHTSMFWDSRAKSLEEQALMVLKSNVEMRGEQFSEDEIIDVVSRRLQQNDEYRTLFTQAFGDDHIDGDRITKAIAAFERSLVANNSRFDQYARGDNSALSQQEIRGLNEFIAAGCTGCHGGPMFSDFELHHLPVKDNDQLVGAGIVDEGAQGEDSPNAFRTPSLRNVALTAPYMHNGTETTLRDAIVFYDAIDNPGNSEELAELNFDDVDSEVIDAIQAFLATLSDESFDKTIPERVPSGLNPGGDI